MSIVKHSEYQRVVTEGNEYSVVFDRLSASVAQNFMRMNFKVLLIVAVIFSLSFGMMSGIELVVF
jgi:hypothetical protein